MVDHMIAARQRFAVEEAVHPADSFILRDSKAIYHPSHDLDDERVRLVVGRESERMHRCRVAAYDVCRTPMASVTFRSD